MSITEKDIIRNYIRDNNIIFYFIAKEDGSVLECSLPAKEFIKNGSDIKNLDEIFKDFNRQVNIKENAENPGKEHLYSINSHKNVPEAFYFSFYPLEKGKYLMIGRMDINEVHNIRLSLVEMNNELSNLSRELHKKNAELKNMNEMKNNFLGMAAHDIRKPISVIKGYSKLLLNGAAGECTDRQKEFVGAMERSAENMQKLVNDFLDVSIIESGKLKLENTDIDIKKEIINMLELSRMKAENRGIKLEVEVLDNTGIISADRMKLQQVLDNVTGNAVEYTPDNGTVSVKAYPENNSIMFVIEDEGPGIPEDKKNMLFRYFGKTGAGKASGDKSTGLGLVISRKIIEEHGGKIYSENRDEKGARFKFFIPRKKERS